MTASTSYIHEIPPKEVLFLLNEHFESNCIPLRIIVVPCTIFVCLSVFLSPRVSVFCLPTQLSMFHTGLIYTVCLSVIAAIPDIQVLWVISLKTGYVAFLSPFPPSLPHFRHGFINSGHSGNFRVKLSIYDVIA